MNTSDYPCDYFQIDMMDNSFQKCKNCSHTKSDHPMYKSPSIIASHGKSSILQKINSLPLQEEESKDDKNNANSQKKISEAKSDSGDENSPKQRSSVHRLSLGSVQDIASKFGGQTNASQSNRRNTEINYKVE